MVVIVVRWFLVWLRRWLVLCCSWSVRVCWCFWSWICVCFGWIVLLVGCICCVLVVRCGVSWFIDLVVFVDCVIWLCVFWFFWCLGRCYFCCLFWGSICFCYICCLVLLWFVLVWLLVLGWLVCCWVWVVWICVLVLVVVWVCWSGVWWLLVGLFVGLCVFGFLMRCRLSFCWCRFVVVSLCGCFWWIVCLVWFWFGLWRFGFWLWLVVWVWFWCDLCRLVKWLWIVVKGWNVLGVFLGMGWEKLVRIVLLWFFWFKLLDCYLFVFVGLYWVFCGVYCVVGYV